MSRAEKQLRRRRRREKHGRSIRDPFHQLKAKDPGRWKTVDYDIVQEPLDPEEPANLAFVRDSTDQQRSDVFAQLFDSPEAALPQLRQWLEQHPNAPMLLNWLSMAYGQTDRNEQYEETVRLNYQLNPSYLFARIGYAELCLRKGDPEAAAGALDHKFDLQLLYPHRKVFHLTEYLGFNSVVIEIMLRQGKRDVAIRLLELMEKLAPDSEHVRQARALIYSPLSMLLSRLKRYSK